MDRWALLYDILRVDGPVGHEQRVEVLDRPDFAIVARVCHVVFEFALTDPRTTAQDDLLTASCVAHGQH